MDRRATTPLNGDISLMEPTGARPVAVLHGPAVPRSQPPRWATGAATAIAASAVPSNIWRLALAAGIPVGYDDTKLRSDFDLPGWGGAGYLVALVVVIQGLALLSLGLVRRWGEIVPVWLPHVGGRPVPPNLVVAVAGTGAVVMTLLWVPVGLLWWTSDSGLDGAHHVIAGLCYLPLVVWGPLLAALTIAYRRRHPRARTGTRPDHAE